MDVEGHLLGCGGGQAGELGRGRLGGRIGRFALVGQFTDAGHQPAAAGRNPTLLLLLRWLLGVATLQGVVQVERRYGHVERHRFAGQSGSAVQRRVHRVGALAGA